MLRGYRRWLHACTRRCCDARHLFFPLGLLACDVFSPAFPHAPFPCHRTVHVFSFRGRLACFPCRRPGGANAPENYPEFSWKFRVPPKLATHSRSNIDGVRHDALSYREIVGAVMKAARGARRPSACAAAAAGRGPRRFMLLITFAVGLLFRMLSVRDVVVLLRVFAAG